ncbi:SLC13 family permease [Sporomusa termitida]|uniref:Dass: transporter, divalent anion:Na+ symporter (DASS) family n=1 Tax=Sporomusa termitida TaxID=2377 RepID=A0A517DV39_9FIRM|nr:SLC13 family permease [Sporomusa termitida]QDR81187.1 dass: transporter, divalent anion:Na+ symporter (DASS) family [Sporomusa termitida]
MERTIPAKNMSTTPTTGNTGFYGKIILGLIIMFGFGLLPAPHPITPVGMKLIGIFIGLIYFWGCGELSWPSILGIVAISFYIHDIYPPQGPNPLPAIFKAIEGSAGNWVVAYLVASLLLTYTLNETGIIKRLTLWFMTRTVVKRGPWTYTVALLSTVMFIGLFLDGLVTMIFFLAIAYHMFEKLGYKKGDAYPLMLVIGITFTTNMAFGMTPISHTIVLIGMDVYAHLTGVPIGMLQYMLVGIPAGLVVFALMLLFFRYCVNPDVSNFQNIDYDKLLGERPGPMGLREKMTAWIFGLVVLFWILPGFFDLFAPTLPITKFLHEITILVPTFIGVIVMCVIRVGGKPLLDYEAGFKTIPWGVTTLIMAAMLIGAVLTEKTSGITDYVVSLIMPLVNYGLSPFLLIATLLTLLIVCVNFANHVPMTILMLVVCIPMAATIGIDPLVLGTIIILAAQFGFCVPSSLASIALIYGDPWAKPRKVLLYGLAVMVFSIIGIILIGYPLAVAIMN